jgi:hypothetical protein
MAEFVTCPACSTKVLTAEALLGRRVRCYSCGFRFVAAPDPPEPPAPVPADVTPAPPRFGGDEDDDEDRPFCPGCGRRVSWQATACPLCGEEFEEEEPRHARPRVLDVVLPVRRDGEPHRGGTLFVLGSFGLVAGVLSACFAGFPALLSVPLGVAVWVLATRDLRRMADGSVDPRGARLTRQARLSAAAGAAFGALFATVYALVLLAS